MTALAFRRSLFSTIVAPVRHTAPRLLALAQPGTTLPRTILSRARLATAAMTNITANQYEPFLLPVVPGAETGPNGPHVEEDWTADLDLNTATAFSRSVWGDHSLRVLVLYGSLRER